jgi:hypothetical protein
MFKRWLWLSLLVMACTDKSGNVGGPQPASLQLSVAPGVSSYFSIADLEELHVELQDCAGGRAETDAPEEVDLLVDELMLPGGEWCGLRMEFSGPLSMQGETDNFAIFELRMDLSELELQASTPLSLDGQLLILEIGEPGWVNPPTLGIEASSTFLVDSTHPQHGVLRRQVQANSAVYEDLSADGEVGKTEREAPVLGGVFSMPSPAFVALGEAGRSLISYDGEAWESDQNHGTGLRGAARSHGLMMAVGGDKTGWVMTSLEGESWMDLGDTEGRLTGVASSGSTAVIVGLDGRVSSSSDLLSWTELADADGDPIYQEDFYAVAYGGAGFIVVGEDGQKLWSEDGSTWTEEPGTIHLYDVAWGDTLFVAVGEGGARKQADSNGDWAIPVFGGDDLTGVAYGDGRWVAVGPGRSIISDDAVSWESFPQEFDLLRVAYGEGVFLATSAEAMYSSPDGIRWTMTELEASEELAWIRYLP